MLLYYITDRSQFPGDENSRRHALLNKIAEAAACGVDFIQLREKDLPARELESLARTAVRIIQENSRPGNRRPRTRLLINSRADVAIACGADGVHLRSDDISPRDVRSVWTAASGDSSPIIAVSCHTADEVACAASEAADFAVFAPVFEKKDMPDTPAAGLTALGEACQQKIAVLALGGVTLENAQSCTETGAAGVAGIRLFQDQDIRAVVGTLQSQTRM